LAEGAAGEEVVSAAQPKALALALLACSAFLAMTRHSQIMSAAARPDDSQALAADEKLYDGRCGICHQPGGTGAIMLARRLGKDRSILSTRADLTVDYIRKIVRVGIGSMPPFSRIEVTNSELEGIAAYLTRPASDRAPPAGRPPAKSSPAGAHE
jgi:mono/diheme cytochrome c family protein